MSHTFTWLWTTKIDWKMQMNVQLNNWLNFYGNKTSQPPTKICSLDNYFHKSHLTMTTNSESFSSKWISRIWTASYQLYGLYRMGRLNLGALLQKVGNIFYQSINNDHNNNNQAEIRLRNMISISEIMDFACNSEHCIWEDRMMLSQWMKSINAIICIESVLKQPTNDRVARNSYKICGKWSTRLVMSTVRCWTKRNNNRSEQYTNKFSHWEEFKGLFYCVCGSILLICLTCFHYIFWVPNTFTKASTYICSSRWHLNSLENVAPKKGRSKMVVSVVPTKQRSFAWGMKRINLSLAWGQTLFLAGRAFYWKNDHAKHLHLLVGRHLKSLENDWHLLMRHRIQRIESNSSLGVRLLYF